MKNFNFKLEQESLVERINKQKELINKLENG